jgi:endonuclease YncB( thermonuclease family)
MRSLFLSLIFVISTNFSAFAKGPIRTIEGIVTKVTDGNTMQVTATNRTKLKVRLYGIYAPETGKSGQPYGTNAQRALEEMVVDKHVRLEVMAVDQSKNTVAIVWTVDNVVNKEMLKSGWAWAYRQYLDSPYASEYIELEEQARNEHRGVWEQNDPRPPWESKKQQKKSKSKGRS